MTDKALRSLDAQAELLGIGSYQRHALLCVGPKCCSDEQGAEVWAYLKKRTAELDLTNKSVFRSKVGCLRICQQGPVMVVYPEGTWYRLVDTKACEEIIQSHLIQGIPVEKYCFATNPLTSETAPQ